MPIMLILPALAASLAVLSPASAPQMEMEGGMLSTLPRGPYNCALPGSAAGSALKVVVEEGFTVGASSSYSSPKGNGTYLLRGRILTFTSGPKNGQRYRHTGSNEIQRISPDGTLGRMICSRVGRG